MVKKSKSDSNSGNTIKKKKPRQRSRKAPYKKEQFEKFVRQNRPDYAQRADYVPRQPALGQDTAQGQYPPGPRQFVPPPQLPSTKQAKIAAFLKLLPYILSAILVSVWKYKDVGAVMAKAVGETYVKDNSGLSKDKNFVKQTKSFIDRVIEILASFDTLERLAFATSLFAFFVEDVPKIVKNAQNIQGISYSDIYASIFNQLLKIRREWGPKLGLNQNVYPLNK